MTLRYVVKDEHTLGYLIPDTDLMGVLHGSVLRGGPDWLDGPVLITPRSVIRPATAEDFSDYRVMLPPDFVAAVEVPAVLNWAELGQQLRTAADDADGGKPASPRDVREAYNFLLCNPEAFTDSDTWPANMPTEPNIELIAAYYGVV